MVPGADRHQLIDVIAAADPQPASVVVGELLVARERVEAKVCEALSGFLARGLQQVEGWSSPVGWLRAQGLSDPDAKRLAVRAARLPAWPVLARLWFDGELSGAQVDTVVRLIPKGRVDLYGDHDAEVSPLLVGLTVTDTTQAVRHWVTRAEAVTGDQAIPGADGEQSHLHLSRTLAGRAILDAELDADTAAVAETALRIAERPDEPGEFRTATQRRGDAFGTVLGFFCDHHAEQGSRPGRQHPHVAVTVDPDDLIAAALRGLGITTTADLEALLAARNVGIFEEALFRDALAHAAGTPVDHDRHPLSAASLATLFTHGTPLHRLLIADGQIIDRGRDLRLATPNLRDAMIVRDRGCRFPHRDAPTTWIHAHHLHHWDTDGHTLTSPPPRRHRPPPLPLHHPTLRGLIPEFLEPAPLSTQTADPKPDRSGPPDPSTPSRDDTEHHDRHLTDIDPDEPSDHDTALMVRARVVDLVRRRHRSRRRRFEQSADPDVRPDTA